MADMKLRHAAELALVGWYLMVPPIPLNRFRVDIDAPSSKWEHYQSFDSAEDCESIHAPTAGKSDHSRTSRRISPGDRDSLAERVGFELTGDFISGQ